METSQMAPDVPKSRFTSCSDPSQVSVLELCQQLAVRLDVIQQQIKK